MKNNLIITVLFLIFIKIGYSQTTNISGVVLDNTTKKTIENVHLSVEDGQAFTITNNLGEFELTLNSQDSTIILSHLNYKIKNIILNGDEKLRIYLDKKVIQIDNVIIKGKALEDISHTIVIIDDIKKSSQIRNTADLFKDIPGFSLQKRSSTAIEPSFRSFKYEEMNLRFDGGAKMVHACPNRMDPMTAHLIPEEVQQIEIIKGPYTVRYGQRFGPTINIVTKTPNKNDYGLHGKVEAGYETNGNNLLARAELMYAHKLFDITLNGESRNFGDYVDGDGTVVPSGFKTNSYSLKVGLNPATKHRVVIDWRQKFGDDIKHAGLPMDSPQDDSWLITGDYKFDNISKKVKSLSLKLYTSYVDHIMSNEGRPSFSKMEAVTPVQSNTYGGKLEFAFTPSDKITLYAGLDADIIGRKGQKNVLMKKDMMGNVLPMPMLKTFSVWQDALIQDYGVFVEGNYKINNNFSTTVGVRADYVTSKINTPDKSFVKLYGGNVKDRTEIEIGVNAAVKYRKNGWQAQFAFGRGTRTASMIEKYINRFTIGADPSEYVGNPNLKAEINNQFELSGSKKYKKINIGANVYYSLFENYITAILKPEFKKPMSMGSTKQFVNVAADQFGMELFFNYNFYKDFHFMTDFSYTSAFNKTFGEHLAQVLPFTAHAGLKWEPKKYWIDIRSEFVLEQNQISKSFGETKTPSYILLDLRAGVKPIKNVTIGAAVLNIFNETYYNHLNFSYKNSDINSGKIYETGRSFSLFAKYQF